jgi:type II secretory pathway pseudopilin PulG
MPSLGSDRARPRQRSEAGETLAEILVTLSVLGLAVIIIVGALGTALRASAVHRGHATADTVARSAAETLKDRKLAWNASGTYTVSGSSGVNVSVAARCWKGDTPATFAACPAGDLGLQQLTVTATGNGATETVVVVKRRN